MVDGYTLGLAKANGPRFFFVVERAPYVTIACFAAVNKQLGLAMRCRKNSAFARCEIPYRFRTQRKRA